MNGEEFYSAFKNALNLLHLSWNEKEKATVRVEDNKLFICRTEDNFVASVLLMKEESEFKAGGIGEN